MMAQNHLLAAIGILKIFPNPIIGIPLCLTSHYILDLVTYPSKEMEITLQSDLKSQRDKVTLAFSSSFQAMLILLILAIAAQKGLVNLMFGIFTIAALAPDIVGQVLPILKKDRKSAEYSHKIELVKNPYVKIGIHQTFTLIGIGLLLLAH